jgi:hypothetical protein
MNKYTTHRATHIEKVMANLNLKGCTFFYTPCISVIVNIVFDVRNYYSNVVAVTQKIILLKSLIK